jgi:GH43 family beta-xylosidase
MYYLVRSSGNAVWIDRAASLEKIHNSTPESDSVKVWSPPAGTDYSKQVLAPVLHFLAGKWYIYVAASDGNNSTHRMQVLERNAADPFGAFTYKGKITAATDRWAIDGTAFEWQGAMYFVWSGWPGSTDGQQNLYIAQMDTPWGLSSNRVLISSPTYSWEQHGLPINEGPEALIHNGTLNIIYSASGYWTNQYALGRLTYNGVGSLLSASAWTKASQPVFQATAEVTGVGHASFMKSPDGTEDWIVYHAHANPTTFNEDRVIRIQPFTFNGNGTPNFGQPVPPGEVLDVPSAGPDAERLVVAGDYQADGNADNLDYALWRKTFGATVFSNVAADGSANGNVDAADYVFWRKSVSAPASQLVVVLDERDQFAKPQALVDDSSLTVAVESVAAKLYVTTLPLAPVNVSHGASAKTYGPIASPNDERLRDEALIACLVQRPERENRSGDSRSAISGEESPVEEQPATTWSTLDTAFASLAV